MAGERRRGRQICGAHNREKLYRSFPPMGPGPQRVNGNDEMGDGGKGRRECMGEGRVLLS